MASLQNTSCTEPHHIGLDTHDYGAYGTNGSQRFSPEPGIYIPAEGRNRLEDDLVIQETGEPFNLMRNIPIEVDEIESIMNS
jgi:Xaa-Pro aminopeptidase